MGKDDTTEISIDLSVHPETTAVVEGDRGIRRRRRAARAPRGGVHFHSNAHSGGGNGTLAKNGDENAEVVWYATVSVACGPQ